MIKTVIFDWNGVIVDDIEANGLAMCDIVFELSGQKIDIDVWFKEIKQDWKIFFLEHSVKEADISKVLPMLVEYYPKYSEYIKLSKNVVQVLNYLKENNIKIGILSGTAKQNILSNIERFSLNNYFDFIISGDDVKNQKPHPEPMEKAVKESGVSGKEILYIDDMPIIFEQTRKFGVISVGIKSQISGDLSSADYVINDLSEIINIIANEKINKI